MTALIIAGGLVFGLWVVVCYSLCRAASIQSRQEEEEKRRLN